MSYKNGGRKMTSKKETVLKICEKLKKIGCIVEVEENRYSVQMLVRADDEYEQDSIQVRDIIRRKFIEKGYKVKILGTYWIEVFVTDIEKQIKDCFEVE